MKWFAITAKWDGACDKCEAPFHVGEIIWWSPADPKKGEKRGTNLCQPCHSEGEAHGPVPNIDSK